MKPDKPLRLGVAGLGTVGGGLMDLLSQNAATMKQRCGRAINLTGVSARTVAKLKLAPPKTEWFADPVDLASSAKIDVFVELIGGEEGQALASVEAALEAGKHVVTANKAMLAKHGSRLAAMAEERGVALNFEAAVAGGIPIVKAMRESLLGNSVTRVYGILNGTSNYILTRMQREGLDFAEALAEAQSLGYAEADPTFDVDGQDAAHKLALLSSLAFGVAPRVENIDLEGIRYITPADFEAADELGYRIKLLAVALKTASGVEARVSPTMVPKTSAIAGVDGVLNCVAVEGDYSGLIVLSGPGAGARPTASSVASDIADIARGNIAPPFMLKASQLKVQAGAPMRGHEGGYYIRLSVYDRRGAFAAIASRMAEEGISLESIVQKRGDPTLPGFRELSVEGEPTPVVMITHRTSEASVRRALEAITEDGHVDAPPRMLRIERL